MDEGMTNDELQFWFNRNTSTTFRCEVELQPLCKRFDELYPECTPAPNNRASWYVGLRKILREFGSKGGVIFIEFAHNNAAPHLMITDAHSIGFLIPQFKKMKVSACQTCREHWSTCQCEWGSKMRSKKYGGG